MLKPTLSIGEIPRFSCGCRRDKQGNIVRRPGCGCLCHETDGPCDVPNPQFPHDGKCSSGHYAPEGTRFFAVSGETLEASRTGIYCEPCLIVANKLAALKKEGLGHTIDPEVELNKLLAEGNNE